MMISEAYEKLDRKLGIAIPQKEDGIFRITSRLENRIPAYIFHGDSGAFVQLFFSKSDPPKGNLSPILAREDLIEKTGYYAITEKISDYGGMEGVSRIQETDSVTMVNSYFQKGVLHMAFRFHSSFDKEINSILSDYVGRDDGFRILYMKRTESLKERILHVDSETPVSLVRYSLDIPESLKPLQTYVKGNNSAVMEMRGREVFDEGIRVLLYADSDPKIPGIKIISRKENIYELSVYEKTQVEARKETNRLGIPRVAFFLTLEGGRLMDTTFLPSAEADEYVSTLLTLDNRLRGSRPVLEYYERVEESIWKWI